LTLGKVTDRLLTPEALATALLAHATAPPRIAFTKQEAAAAIGVSVDFFEQHVQPDLKLVRQGRKVLIPVAELEAWVSENAQRTLGA
jgi:excisionase family DNA binding protein